MIEIAFIAGAFFGVFQDLNMFVAVWIFIAGMIGLFSVKLTLGAFGAFLFFAYVSMQADIFIYDNLLYVVIVTMLVVLGFRVRSYTMGGQEVRS